MRARLEALFRIGTIALGSGVGLGCGDDAVGPGAPEAAYALAIVSGNGQQGVVGTPLTDALQVRVTDAAGAGVPQVWVTWRVDSGDGSLVLERPARLVTTKTDDDGNARVPFTPTLPGPATVVAWTDRVSGPPATFTIHVTCSAPADFWLPVLPAGSVRFYERVGEVHPWGEEGPSVRSRYVLHEAGEFSLQHLGDCSQSEDYGAFEYSGTYSFDGNTWSFDFVNPGDSMDARWSATGTFRRDSLDVDYNPDMNRSGVEDGTYVRAR